MVLITLFIAGFVIGYYRAFKFGGGVMDRLRYGFIHGLVAALAVYIVATLADWWGLLA
jgi:hypothetical protein